MRRVSKPGFPVYTFRYHFGYASDAKKSMEKTNYNLLIVDDSSTVRAMLTMHVELLGFKAYQAENGEEALEILRRQGIDLIISDIMMPKMDGYRLLETLKADDNLRHIPVIVISSVDEIDSIARCIELGAEDFLSKNFNSVLLRARIDACLEKKRLRDVEIEYMQKIIDFEKNEREKILKELEIAKEIQASMLTDVIPDVKGLSIWAMTEPAKQVGGDFYDFITLSDVLTGFVIGDVSGKGVPAALFMALSMALVRACALDDTSALNAITKAHRLILEYSKASMFVTLFYVIINSESHTMSYVNAGHNPVLLLKKEGGFLELAATGIMLGALENIELEEVSMKIESGDILVLYTDGATDAINKDREFFGMDRLREVILRYSNGSSRELAEAIKGAVLQFAGDQPQFDDITLMVVKIL
ncbi:MAG: SpoIIE family protein phosphatase [Nitrospirae bacterium]|nr:SpoIIE family protein phosphatase [Nitrospirota bacterium]